MPNTYIPMVGAAFFGGATDGDLCKVSGLQAVRKTNLSATTDPGASDDANAGYLVGSRWINTITGKVWEAVSVATASAVWKDLTATTPPSGSGTELQVRGSSTAFGALTGSSSSNGGIALVSQATGSVPLSLTLASGQSADAFQITSHNGTAGDKFKVAANGNTTITGSFNALNIGDHPITGSTCIWGSPYGVYFHGILGSSTPSNQGWAVTTTGHLTPTYDSMMVKWSGSGIVQNAAGVIEVNNGTAGVFGDVKVRRINTNGTASNVVSDGLTTCEFQGHDGSWVFRCDGNLGFHLDTYKTSGGVYNESLSVSRDGATTINAASGIPLTIKGYSGITSSYAEIQDNNAVPLFIFEPNSGAPRLKIRRSTAVATYGTIDFSGGSMNYDSPVGAGDHNFYSQSVIRSILYGTGGIFTNAASGNPLTVQANGTTCFGVLGSLLGVEGGVDYTTTSTLIHSSASSATHWGMTGGQYSHVSIGSNVGNGTDGIRLAAVTLLKWTNDSSRSVATVDIALARNAVGVGEANSGTFGQYRDWIFRSIGLGTAPSGTSGSISFADGGACVVGTTTGTKFGTSISQKMGWWNATPIVQPSAAAQVALINDTAGSYDGTLEALPDPTDSPASADALRDDLVSVLLPALRNNFTDLYTQVAAVRTALVNAGLMKGAA